MVAPHNNGELLRSLVRVPGSGSNQELDCEPLDLGRVSTLAATVQVKPIPRCLQTRKRSSPTDLTPKQNSAFGILHQTTTIILPPGAPRSPLTGSLSSSSETSVIPAGDPHRTVHAGGSARVPSVKRKLSPNSTPPPKMARFVYMTPQQVISQAGNLVPVSTPVGPVLFLPLHPEVHTPSPSLGISLAELIRDRDTIRQENVKLKQIVSLFQQLFHDKERLMAVVQRVLTT